MAKEVLVISDIHGRGSELKMIIQKLYNRLDEFKFILLGDYIGYGKNNIEVIRMIKLLREKTECIVLKGNWEDMFLTYAMKHDDNNITSEDKSKIETFKSKNGLNSYYEIKRDQEMYDYFIGLIKEMPLYHTEEINKELFIFAHSGINFHKGIKEISTYRELLEIQNEYDLMWNFSYYTNVKAYEEFYKHLDCTIVSGHTPTCIINDDKSLDLFNLNNKVLGVDFAASRKSGKLGVVNLSQKDFPVYYQSYL